MIFGHDDPTPLPDLGTHRTTRPGSSGSRSRSRASGPKRLAHHWPGGPPPGHFPEPGAVVHGLRSEEHEIRVASFVLVHRIGLHEASTAPACVVHGCPEHPLSQAPATSPPV